MGQVTSDFFQTRCLVSQFCLLEKDSSKLLSHFVSLVIIPYEEVVNQLAADTLSTDASIGMNGGRFTAGSFSKLLKISITVNLSESFRVILFIF